MCDLIDLESPDGKSVGPKLASPLIPAPAKSPTDGRTDSTTAQSSSGLNYVKRSSLDNNPFDNALHKTAEYVRKQEDPFEVVLEKALKHKEHNLVLTPKARSVEFNDDFTPKKTRYSDILKMNKTLDDSLIELQVYTSGDKKPHSSPCPNDSIIHDLNNTNLLSGCNDDSESATGPKFRLRNGRLVPKISLEPADLSILNQSAMNDSLTESGESSEDFLIKSIVAQRISMCIEKGTSDANCLAAEDVPKCHKMRRSLSQGDRLSPRKFRQHRSRSIVDSLKASVGNDTNASICSVASILTDDNMNRAFLQTQCTSNFSDFSNISNISAITRLTSASSACNSSNSSAAVSNRTVNCAFIESSASGTNVPGERGDGRLSSMSRIHSTGSIAVQVKSPMRDLRIKDDISDLLFKYSRLKVTNSERTAAEAPTVRLPSIVSGSRIVGGCVREKLDDKLIDVDVFVPALEPSPPLEQSQRQSVSSTSSDSVFVESLTVEKFIHSEAKSLAKTFEELAGKTSCSSGSSNSDDLLNSRPHWNFDLLPVSDDEPLTDNLIELPSSPTTENSPKIRNTEASATNENQSSTSSEQKSDKSLLKELESEFIDAEKKVYASTLLTDLEKLVKSEGNPEAVKLLENLERALGVKYESNTELLASCFSEEKNNLTKSPKRSESNLGNENIRGESSEKSCEDNVNVESSESLKQLSLSEMNLHNNLNVKTEINKSDKSLLLVSQRTDDPSAVELAETEIRVSRDDLNDDSIEAIKRQNRITDDQKMAVEILVGLGKLLSGENKDPVTVTLLKNLGTALNLVSENRSNSTSTNGAQIGAKESKRVDTPVKKRVPTPTRKPATLSAFSRSASTRRSLETSKSKAAAERVLRRSISVTHTTSSPTRKVSSSALPVDKSKAHLKDVRTRFASDPGSANAAMERKREIQAVPGRKLSRDISLKPVGISELARQERPSSTVVETVKSKLRKKTDTDSTSRRGPMKALIPLGNMQRRGSIGRRASPLNVSVTPPKVARETSSDFTVTTSTPFPEVNLAYPKKSPKTKPMASSTPDAVGPKSLRRSAPVLPSPGRSALSYNISPVTSKTGEDNGANSSKENSFHSKSSKISKICTPSKSRSSSQLPKVSPMCGAKNSPKNLSRGQRRSEPLQSFLPRSLEPPKSPSIRVTEASSSPLNKSSKLASKVKPLNLISKLRRRSGSVADKENCA